MDRISIRDAKAKRSQLVEEVRAGGEVVITKGGKPVARLIAPEAPRKSSPARAAKRIRALCERLNIRGFKIRELIEQGRD